MSDGVHDGVLHLPAAAEGLELAEQGRHGAEGQLALAPRLIEEGHRQVRLPVEEHRLDKAAPVASAPAGDLADLGEDGGLFAEAEVGDLGALGAVEVAAGIVLEHVEDGFDAQHGQALLELRADARELGDRQLIEEAEGPGHRPDYGLLDTQEVWIQGLSAVVDLAADLRPVLAQPLGDAPRLRRAGPVAL